MENINQQWEEADSKATVLAKQMANLEGQLADAQDLLQDETRQKLSTQTKLRGMEDQVQSLQEQLDEEEEVKRQLESKVATTNAQVLDYKKRLEEGHGLIEASEEQKKRMARDMDALQARIDALTSENDKLQKSKKKLQTEVEDLNVEMSNQRSQLSGLDKRQRKFDQMVAEEKAVSERHVNTVHYIV